MADFLEPLDDNNELVDSDTDMDDASVTPEGIFRYFPCRYTVYSCNLHVFVQMMLLLTRTNKRNPYLTATVNSLNTTSISSRMSSRPLKSTVS